LTIILALQYTNMKRYLPFLPLLPVFIILSAYSNLTKQPYQKVMPAEPDTLLAVSPSLNLSDQKMLLGADTVYTSLLFPSSLIKMLPGSWEDKIQSFHLPKGYMVVFAENGDGTGESACYVAVKTAIDANLPQRLRNNISYVRMKKFNNPSKKGTASVNSEAVKALGGEWYYGWSLNKQSFNGQQYVPMTWGKTSSNDNNAKALMERKDVDHLLSFNEPDNKTQSNIANFDSAVALYKQMQKQVYG